MKKLSMLALLVALVFAYGCTPKATQEEANAACKKLVSFEKIPPVPDTTQDIMKQYQPKIQELNNKKEEAKKAVTAKFQKDIDKVEKMKTGKPALDKAKAAAKEKLDAKMKPELDKIDQDPQYNTADLNKEMTTKINEARAKKAEAEKKAKEAQEKKVTECTEKAIAEGLSQPKAQCQAGAPTKEEFDKCQ